MATDTRSAFARGYAWASRAVTIVIGMLLPGFAGYAGDNYLGTLPVLTLLGFAIGFAYGILQLSQLGKKKPTNRVAADEQDEPIAKAPKS